MNSREITADGKCPQCDYLFVRDHHDHDGKLILPGVDQIVVEEGAIFIRCSRCKTMVRIPAFNCKQPLIKK